MQRARIVAVALVAALAVTSCSSSSGAGPDQHPSTASGASGPAKLSPPAGLSTPASPTLPAASTPAAASTKPTRPASPFETDPAVRTLRAWAVQAAKAVNRGKYDDAALDELVTARLRRFLKAILGNGVGFHYPGPVPFTPTSVRAVSPTERHVNACAVSSGYAIDPKTGRPPDKYHVTPFAIEFVRASGRWRLDVFTVGTFTCRGVRIPKPSF